MFGREVLRFVPLSIMHAASLIWFMLNVWNRFSIIFSLICFHLFISTPGGARGKPQPRPPQHDQAQDQEEAAQEDPRAGQPDGDHHHQPAGWADQLPGRGGRRLRGHGWGDAERQKQWGRGDRGRGLHGQARGRAEEWVVLWQTGGIRSIRGDVWVSSRISGLSSGNYSSINTGAFFVSWKPCHVIHSYRDDKEALSAWLLWTRPTFRDEKFAGRTFYKHKEINNWQILIQNTVKWSVGWGLPCTESSAFIISFLYLWIYVLGKASKLQINPKYIFLN